MVMPSQPVRVEPAPGGVLSRRWLGILRGICERAFVPPPPIRQWVENQRIPIKATHNRQAAKEQKCWNFTDFPVMADWVFEWLREEESEVLFLDGQTRRVRNRTAAVLKDAQSGLTSTMIHGVAWWLTWQSGNVIMVTASRDMARDGGKDKLDILDEYPELAAAKRPDSTAMALRYDNSIVWLGGGQSASAFISNPASLVICDEPVKHTMVNGMIPMNMLVGRLKADDEGRMISFSTPDDALEFERNPLTQALQPLVTVETAIHASFLSGTQERVELPCPHCGHYQPLDWQRLQFAHCKVSLPGVEKPIWDQSRVAVETWYQCANPECTDLHADGTVRGKIEEHHKRGMIARRRYVAQNLEFSDGHRTLQAGGMFNLAYKASTWGAIANAFLDAQKNGSAAAMKGFLTDVIGVPFSRYQIKEDNLEAVRRLRRGYRRQSYDLKPLLRIPINTEDIRIIGCTADVQRTPGMEAGDIGAVKYYFFAAGKDGQQWGLDWGSVPSLDDLPDLIEAKVFCSKDEEIHHLTVDVVCIDTGYAKEKVYAFLASQGGSHSLPRWCGLRGGSRENDAALRGRPRITKEYPAHDRFNNPTVLRVLRVRTDHWENELQIERIAKELDGKRTAPAVNLPNDADQEFLEELSNSEQFWDKPNKGNVRELKWKKRHTDKPNDHADNVRNALAVIEAVEEELATGRAQL